MSSREPLWYCHECHSEMRPLMVPDPHCASCNGTFVEKMENPEDDPRQFSGAAGEFDDPFSGDGILLGLQNIIRAMGQASPPQPRPRSPPTGSPRPPQSRGNGYTLRINRTSGPDGQSRTTFSTGSAADDGFDDIPTFSDFLGRNRSGSGSRPRPEPTANRDTIDGSLMLQYLLSMLQQPGGQGPAADMFRGMFAPGAENGRMGDYVFSQDALDQIITQIMESSSAHPVPATDEIMEKLPREVLEEGSPLLEKDCAVCKDQFQLGTEDPDEQVVVSLPCKHPFHEPCITPWLKSSGTCPVCRYQLVPQPTSHAPNSASPSSNNPQQRSPDTNNDNGPGGLFGNIMQILSNSATSTSATTRSSGSNNNNNSTSGSGSSRPPASRHQSHNDHEFPGGWNDVD